MTDEVTKKPTLDQVFRDALQLPFTDLEVLIKRLTEEQEERLEKIRKRFEEGRPLGARADGAAQLQLAQQR